MLEAIIYCIVAFFAIVSFLLYKKSEKEQYLAGWIPASVLLFTCYQCLLAAIYGVIGIPIVLLSMAIADLLPAVFFGYQVFVKKERQQYVFAWWDAAAYILVGILALSIMFLHYSGFALLPNYSGIDQTQHWKASMDLATQHTINGMFYSKLFNGILMEIFLNFVPLDYSYKIFVAADLIDFSLAALMFYGLIRKMAQSTFAKCAALLFICMYVLGYPLEAIMEGFVYLGMGVTLVALILFLTSWYTEKVGALSTICVSLALLGLVLCYSLFAPIVYVVVFLQLLRLQKEKHAIVSKQTVGRALSLFLVPCIIGVYYSFFGMFGDDLSVATQISSEGAIYKDLYSNFIFVFILAVAGCVFILQKQENTVLLDIFLLNTIFMITLFIGGMFGKVSAYYFYKLYFLEWLLCFAVAFAAIADAKEKKEALYPAVILGVWCAIAAVGVFHIEEKIEARAPGFDSNIKASTIVNIYAYNYATLRSPGYSIEKQALYHEACRIMQAEDCQVGLAGFWHDAYWYMAFTNLRWDWYFPDSSAYFLFMRDDEIPYTIVLKDSQIYAEHEDFFSSQECIYENGIGTMIRINADELNAYCAQMGY